MQSQTLTSKTLLNTNFIIGNILNLREKPMQSRCSSGNEWQDSTNRKKRYGRDNKKFLLRAVSRFLNNQHCLT